MGRPLRTASNPASWPEVTCSTTLLTKKPIPKPKPKPKRYGVSEGGGSPNGSVLVATPDWWLYGSSRYTPRVYPIEVPQVGNPPRIRTTVLVHLLHSHVYIYIPIIDIYISYLKAYILFYLFNINSQKCLKLY